MFVSAILKAAMLGNETQESHRRTSRLILTRLPFADGLLPDAEPRGHLRLGHPKVTAQCAYPPTIPTRCSHYETRVYTRSSVQIKTGLSTCTLRTLCYNDWQS